MSSSSRPRRHRSLRLAAAALLAAVPPLGAAEEAPATPAPPAPAAAAAARRAVHAHHVKEGTIRVDGLLNEPEWAAAEVATGFIQFRPTANAPATEQTEARVLVSDEAIYFGARLLDGRPQEMIAPLARRDTEDLTDVFWVGIDSQRDRRTAVVFGVSPSGMQQDMFFYEDTKYDMSWDAAWDSAVKVDEGGWNVEIRIPLSQLRFRAPDGVWGVNFCRVLARRVELTCWSPRPRDRPANVSVYGDLLDVGDLPPPRPLELIPSAGGEVASSRATQLRGWNGAVAGLDARYAFDNGSNAALTVNPDFGQVEADPSDVNLSAYETFFPEKRPFFVERSDIFHLPLGLGRYGADEQLFYSRRIGRPPQLGVFVADGTVSSPAASRIAGALRLTGKNGAWSYGVLDGVTTREEARVTDPAGAVSRVPVEPASNYAVARAVYESEDGASALGATSTAARRWVDGPLAILPESAVTGGADGRRRFSQGDYELRGWALGSRVAGSVAAIDRLQRSSGHYFQRPDAGHLGIEAGATALAGYSAAASVEKIGGGHWRWFLGGLARSPGFDVNDLGFQRASDVLVEQATFGYDNFRSTGLLRAWYLGLTQGLGWTYGGEAVSNDLGVTGNCTFQNEWAATGSVVYGAPVLSVTALRGGPAVRTQGRVTAQAMATSDPRQVFTYGAQGIATWDLGSGGSSYQLGPQAAVRLARLTVSLEPYLALARVPFQYVGAGVGPAGAEYVVAALDQRTLSLTLRTSYLFNPALSLQVYAQAFLSAGAYDRFQRVAQARAADPADRYRPVAVTAGDGTLSVDADGDGAPDFVLGAPDFTARQLRATTVLRWEFAPGSAATLVWNRTQDVTDGTASFQAGDGLRRLFDGQGRDVFLAKLSFYWR